MGIVECNTLPEQAEKVVERLRAIAMELQGA
jgi:hypothetical protein